MNLSFVSAVLSGLIFVQNAYAFEIRRISDREQWEGIAAYRVQVVSKDPDCFVYYNEYKHQNPNNTDIELGTYIHQIWKTCGVFSDQSNKTHTLLSSSRTGLYTDKYPHVSNDGTKVCYVTKFFGAEAPTSIAVVNTDTMTVDYIGRQSFKDVKKYVIDAGKSIYCNMSPDGNSVAIESSVKLVPGATHTKSKYQIYATHDGGNNYVNPVGNEYATTTFTSSYPQMSYDGRYTIFNGKQRGLGELYFYTNDSTNLDRLTDFAPNKCDLVAVYEAMKEYWGESNLIDAGVTKATHKACINAAVLGWKVNGETAISINIVGVGHGPARMDDENRFITYTADFAHANTGSSRIVTAANLFLRDNRLGLIWQITSEAESGDPDIQSKIEKFCCPSDSASKQRETCSKNHELNGYCCWQKTCWFPAQWPDISGDGSSIAFVSSMEPGGKAKDYDLQHYHVRTGVTSILTNTQDPDFDETYPTISHKGDVVAFQSSYDFQTPESNNGKQHVFATKLNYGCNAYENAENFTPDIVDVEEQCQFRNPAPEEPFTFSGHGVKIGFDFVREDLMKNIPAEMISTGYNSRKFCKTFVKSLLDDLSFAMQFPVTFFKVSKKSMRKCINKTKPLKFEVAFLSNDMILYKPLSVPLQNLISSGPSSWYRTLERILKSPRGNSNYLLKEYTSAKQLTALTESDY